MFIINCFIFSLKIIKFNNQKNLRKNALLYDIDIFGLSIPLRFKQKPEYKTKCSLFSSIVFYIVTLILIIIFGMELWKRSNFSIISSLESDVSSAIDLSEVPIMFSLQTTLVRT